MIHRSRRLRANPAIRNMVRETILHPNDFIAPLFVVEGSNVKEEISSMPGYFRYSLDMLKQEVKELDKLGVQSLLLFVKVSDHLKDNTGKEAVNPNGLMQTAIKEIKSWAPHMCLMTDVALDPFSSFGHDGIVREGKVVNDETVKILSEMAVTHADAGADFIAPSDMMDGRILSIREALEEANHADTGIMAYSAKYASCFYGPFRDALDSAPGFGDKKTYQMDPSNTDEGVKEALDDQAEGADIVMVKPAMSYLDIIYRVKQETAMPVSAYHVSGEYAMIKAAAAKGWLNEKEAMVESLTSIKRAGADLIATYFVKDIIKEINS